MLKHLTLAVTLVSALPAFAQDATDHTGHMMGDMGPSSMAFMEANARMHEMMAMEYTGNADVDFIKTKDGKTIDWRADVTGKLLNLQKGDGSWINDQGRWMESDPVLTTSYILMALGRIHQTL